MNNTLRITLLSLCGLSLAGTHYVPHAPSTVQHTPIALVEVVTSEIEYEYLPPVTVTIPHDEVVIIDQGAF
jgi:hypothetical protein